MCQSRTLLFIFVLFTLQFKFKLKKPKLRCCAWDWILELQDGRRGQIHWALVATNHGRDISRGIISQQKSGRVGSRSRSGRPPWFFDKSGSGSGRPPRFFDKLGHVGMPYPEFSSIFPGHFRSEKNREKSREIGINRGKSGTIPTVPDLPRTF